MSGDGGSGAAPAAAGCRINNLNYLKCSIGGGTDAPLDISFDCTSKTLPALKDASTWTVVTDNAEEKTGKTYKGKCEGYDAFEVVTPTDITTDYGSLQDAALNNETYTVTFTYDEGGSFTPKTITVPNCYILSVKPSGGDNNGNSTTTIQIQPRGGGEEDLPEVA